MTKWPISLLAVAVALALPGGGAHGQERPRPADHVIVIMLDGVRADALRLADVPAVERLAEGGTRFLQARTMYPSQTRVAFVSLPTGAYAGSHGIVGGDFFLDADWQMTSLGREPDPVPAQALVARRTMFEEAAAAGLTSLYAAMKGYELVGARGATWTINGNQTLDPAARAARYVPAVHGSAALALWYKQLLSRQLLDQSLQVIRESRPNLVVLNLGSADYVAHTYGPNAPEYRRTIEFLDGLIAELLAVLDELHVRDRTAIVVSADHGFSHGDGHTMAAVQAGVGAEIPALRALGIEHVVTNTGGTSLGIYVRDKRRLAEVVATLRDQPWTESVYCEAAVASCDRTLSSLHAFFAGRSPDVMVDLDESVSVNYPTVGNHGSLRPADSHIPLILSGAGVAAGRVAGKAEIVDVAPTVMRLLGITPRLMQPDGRVLAEALAETPR